MHKSSLIPVALSLFCFSIISACYVITKDSPAPGCVESIGIAPMGGCSGKHATLDLAVENAPACLRVELNNCNGGVLVVQNNCSGAFELGEVGLEPGARESLDVLPVSAGGFEIQRLASNFSGFLPENEVPIQLEGRLGEEQVTIQYIKSGPLCQ